MKKSERNWPGGRGEPEESRSQLNMFRRPSSSIPGRTDGEVEYAELSRIPSRDVNQIHSASSTGSRALLITTAMQEPPGEALVPAVAVAESRRRPLSRALFQSAASMDTPAIRKPSSVDPLTASLRRRKESQLSAGNPAAYLLPASRVSVESGTYPVHQVPVLASCRQKVAFFYRRARAIVCLFHPPPPP